MKFLKVANKRNVFEFECSCGATGEIGVPAKRMNEVFPHDICGALLIQKPATSFFGKPTLELVSEAA